MKRKGIVNLTIFVVYFLFKNRILFLVNSLLYTRARARAHTHTHTHTHTHVRTCLCECESVYYTYICTGVICMCVYLSVVLNVVV